MDITAGDGHRKTVVRQYDTRDQIFYEEGKTGPVEVQWDARCCVHCTLQCKYKVSHFELLTMIAENIGHLSIFVKETRYYGKYNAAKRHSLPGLLSLPCFFSYNLTSEDLSQTFTDQIKILF